MKNINWRVRFNKNNVFFLLRVVVAVLTPALAFNGSKVEDLTSWQFVIELFKSIIANPYLLGLTIISFLNILPDPTTKGVGDSEIALTYTEPKEDN